MKLIRAAALVTLIFLCFGFTNSNNSGVIRVGNARFTVVTPQCIRLEYSDKGLFIDEPSLFAINRDTRDTNFRLEQSASQTIIDTGQVRLIYTPDGNSFSDKNLKALIQSEGKEILWTPSKQNRQNLGGTRLSLDDKYGASPVSHGLLSRDGWFLLDDSKRNLFHGQNNWVAERPKSSGSDWYLFGYGLDYKSALKSFTAIGGEVPMPRRYVLGSWYSRWWSYTSDDYRKIVAEYHEHNFPLDNLVMDKDWHEKGWSGYTWNKKLFPDSEAFLKFIHNENLFASLNEHPQAGVLPQEERYNDFMNAMGEDASQKHVLKFDAGDQKYITNFFHFMHGPLEKMGTDLWWLDWKGDKKSTFNHLDWLNEFYYEQSRQNGLRGQQFSRWGGWGDHRHPIHFSGDTISGWRTLKFQIPFTANSGNVGAFFWTHDIGGFMGLRNGQLLTRWVQFGAFSAALRLHSVKFSFLDRRPWTYSQEQEAAMQVAFHLRSEFFPLTYSHVWQASKESIPLIRPLYIEYPQIEEAYKNPQEYLYGDDVLVAPITTPVGPQKVASQKVFFPPGIWYDWFTGVAYQGPMTKTFSKDLNTFPLFVRGGVPLTLQPYSERMTTDPIKTLVVRIYQGENGIPKHSFLYEDDGLTDDYKKGVSALTNLDCIQNGDQVSLKISSTEGSFKGQVQERAYVVELFSADPKMPVKRISIPSQSIRQSLKIETSFR
jgi:alpha-glucosidase (family GH31 glycosyl hydrolase)